MKFTKFISNKLFKSKKLRTLSKSGNLPTSSFSSHTTSSSSSSSENVLSTPTTVLPSSTVISPQFSSNVYFELKQAFEMIDTDGDGKIEKQDLEQLLCRIGATPPLSKEELNLMLDDVDIDGDGCISLQEFYAIGSAFAPPPCDGELKEVFAFFDSDHDGRITAEELLDGFKTIGDARCTLEDCRRMIGGVDSNGDGFVCFEDFSRMMDQQYI